MSKSSEATEILLKQLGGDAVKTDHDSCFIASLDDTRISFLPDAVVFPRDEKDIEQLLKLANDRNVPVTVRGAGTGKVGGCIPVAGGWVLSLEHWTDFEIDALAGTATVQPGVITQKLNDAAARYGLFFPPDPASVKYCSIGGNIATNAGGLRAAKYGVTRDYVLALEGFLPTGEKVRWGANVRKFASGLNLRDLWIGAEGMLGVITRATLRLAPLPESRHTFLCAFVDDVAALKAAQALVGTRVQPSVLEFLDSLTVSCAEKRRGKPFFDGLDREAILLVEVDGDSASVPAQAERVRRWAVECATNFAETNNPAEAESLWEARRTCSQAMFLLADSKLNEDICVPHKNYLSMLDAMRDVTKRTGLATPIFGHAADGNFHVHIMYNRGDANAQKNAQEAISEVMKKVVQLGGVITGEHGIGLSKSPFLSIQHTPAEISAMLAVKRALDPRDILGRGKMFRSFNVWDCVPAEVKLPWDK